MVVIQSNLQTIAVTVSSNTILANFDLESSAKVVECDKQLAFHCGSPTASTRKKFDYQHEDSALPSSDFSSCGFWFAFAYGKCLSLWDVRDCSLVSNRLLQKRSSKLRFTPSGNDIIVADKAGDVYSFSRKNPFEAGILLLGHLSMLLDVIISADEKFIITCDRDEKIRVSLYPNSYNINSYCLGHDEFVTSLAFLPHCEDILISSSGDGTLKLWNFKNGKEILTINCHNDVLLLGKHHVGGNGSVENVGAVISCTAVQINTDESLVCVTVYSFHGCIVYKIKGSLDNLAYEQYDVKFASEPFDIFIDKNKVLWVILQDDYIKISALKWDNDGFSNISDSESRPMVKHIVQNINQELRNFTNLQKKKQTVPLYKKSFNNVEEYFKRKNERISLQNIKKLKDT